MKLFPFEKFQATGNDFIILDFMEESFLNLEDISLMKLLCDRRFGIGADGIIAMCPEYGYDFRMKYLNSDGRFSSFCGNGSRCIAQYYHLKYEKESIDFIAADGPHSARILNQIVEVKMRDMDRITKTAMGAYIDSGSPHLIIPAKDLGLIDLVQEGRRIRNEFSTDGVNVNFIQWDQSILRIKTYERGVEDRTLSCGTGITAASYYVAITEKKEGTHTIHVQSDGGPLSVTMNLIQNKAENVWLKGPAVQVFSGFYPLDKF